MKFILYCGNNPVDLGIKDEQGYWDLMKFREHVEDCVPCKKFLYVLGEEFFDSMLGVFGTKWKVGKT